MFRELKKETSDENLIAYYFEVLLHPKVFHSKDMVVKTVDEFKATTN